jgi:hypothetical protein
MKDYLFFVLLLALVIGSILYTRERMKPARYNIPKSCVLVEMDNNAADISRLRFVCHPKLSPSEVEGLR